MDIPEEVTKMSRLAISSTHRGDFGLIDEVWRCMAAGECSAVGAGYMSLPANPEGASIRKQARKASPASIYIHESWSK